MAQKFNENALQLVYSWPDVISCFLQGVFRSALSRTEPPETFALQTVQEAIKPQVYSIHQSS